MRMSKVSELRQDLLEPVLEHFPSHVITEEHQANERLAIRWRWLSMLSVVAAGGLLIVSLADAGGHREAPWAETLFWLGLLVLFVPITLRLTSPTITHTEGVGLIIILGLGLYLVKVMHSPEGFTYFDEFLHWRTYNDILASSHLFTKNLVLPVSAQYPTLEIVTVALTSLTGLPFFVAGVVIVGVIRVVFVVALYLFFEQISGLRQVGYIASVLYMANPNYLFFNAMFKYESLALALTALALFVMIRRQNVHRTSWARHTLLAGLIVLAVVTTHHLTAFALTGFLGVWGATAWYTRRHTGERSGPLDMLLLAGVANALWLHFVADRVGEYLLPLVSSAGTEFINLLRGQASAPRQLFVSSSGIAPLWERVVGLGSAGLILLGLAVGLWQLWRNHRYRGAALALGIGAMGYPISLVMRLSGRSWEVGYRATEFLFVAVAFVVALGVVEFGLRGRWPRWAAGIFVAAAAVIFLGGIVNGWSRQWRLPGPYLPAQDTRSVEPEGILAAEWARAYLGPDRVMAADRTNTVLMATYGDQHVRTTISGAEDPGWVLYSENFGLGPRGLIQRNKIQYMVVDYRLVAAPNLAVRYFDNVPVDEAFAKFDATVGVNRVFDSGSIRIYDVGALGNVP